MYAPFFGLSKEPFSIAPDPRFLFMSDRHREALAHLLYGLGGGGGFVLLTGEVGAGKTTVCRCFLEQVPAQCAVAYIFNPKLTAVELLQTVCAEFGIAPPEAAAAGGGSIKVHVDALNTFLLEAHAQGRQAVLVIDEAQSLSADVLEQLRLLTNLETTERKLLQIVLIGQPELRQMLARPELEQLAQRVIARYHLNALSPGETHQYIRHRLSVASGAGAAMPFDAGALARIHALSGGVPRRINLLADRALLGAYSQGLHKVGRRIVDRAAREVFDVTPAVRKARRWALPAGAAIVAGLAVWALLAWQQRGADQEVDAAAMALLAGGKAAAPPPPASAASSVAAAAAASSGASLPLSPPGAVAASAPPALADAAPVLVAAPTLQAAALRDLAALWQVAPGPGEPCSALAKSGLACFRSANGGLALVRQLGRPGLLTLRGASGTPVYALLLSLDDTQATLQAGSRRYRLTLPALAGAWRGDFTTIWRPPPGWREAAQGAIDPALWTWVQQHLAAAGFGGAQPLRDRIWAYQVSQGLPPDGLAGPLSLMRLARAGGPGGAGNDEPRLQPAN